MKDGEIIKGKSINKSERSFEREKKRKKTSIKERDEAKLQK